MVGIIRDGIVTTRKEHQCHGCLKLITTKSRVYSQTCKYEGEIYTLYMCDECKKHSDNCEGCKEAMRDEEFYPGSVKECNSN